MLMRVVAVPMKVIWSASAGLLPGRRIVDRPVTGSFPPSGFKAQPHR
jgi:hypothetical protein